VKDALIPGAGEFPGVSYIMPVLNEAAHVEDAVRSVLAQDYPGEKEVVLALGPSSDGTATLIAALAADDARVRTVDNPTGRTPAGLNAAIRASRFPVVIRVDAHTELPGGYTRRGVATLLRTGASDVGGLMDARGRTPFERAVAAAYASPLGLGGAAYHSGAPEGPAESAYLGIFARKALEEVGLFDETLWRGQDWDLCRRLRQAGHTVWFDPQLAVTYRPRSTWQQLGRQFNASGVWRAELARRHREGRSARHLVPPVVTAAVASGFLAVALLLPRALAGSAARVPLAMAAAPPAAYLLGIVCVALASRRAAGTAEKAILAGVLPTIHFSWALGYIRGRLFGAGNTVDRGRSHQ
jgi:succinoglycan biosynthesis protein ExoA